MRCRSLPKFRCSRAFIARGQHSRAPLLPVAAALFRPACFRFFRAGLLRMDNFIALVLAGSRDAVGAGKRPGQPSNARRPRPCGALSSRALALVGGEQQPGNKKSY